MNITVSGGQSWEWPGGSPSLALGGSSFLGHQIINWAAELQAKIHAAASLLETKSVSLDHSVLGKSLKLMQLIQKMLFEKNQRFIWIELWVDDKCMQENKMRF